MTDQSVLYQGLIVEFWDLLRGDTSGWSSRPYFLEVIRKSGQPALDVACGTGRLLLDYLAAGIDIDGVDISPEMIARCQENAAMIGLAPRTYIQAMQAIDLPRRYRTIIVPSSSFLHLTNKTDARQALERFYTHLEPGGVLSMSMRVFEPEPGAEEWEVVEEAIRPADGSTIRRWFRCTYDVENRLQHTEDRYEVILEGEIIHVESFASSPFLTWYTVAEAIELLTAAGFTGVGAHADFTFAPAAAEETSFIVYGKKP